MNIQTIYSSFLQCSSVSIDTRTIEHEALFIAIKGENFDGNQFAQKALDSGAKYAVVSDPALEGECFILVKDTLHTLQELANYHRRQLDSTTFIALTGSNGKTTTKELVAHFLAEKFRVQFTTGNYNNHLGVPLTLLRIQNTTEIAIIEMGANHCGEIAELCEIAEPDFGFITNIGRAHIGEFGGQANIIKAKTELYDFLKSRNRTIFYKDTNRILVEALADYEHKLAYSDLLQNYNYELLGFKPKISCSIGNIICELDLGGTHNVENMECALSISSHFGLDPKQVRNAIESFRAPDNRSQWVQTEKNKVFLDAYNSNPDSMKAAVDYILSLDAENTVVVLGEMLELGEYAKKEHENLHEFLEQSNVDFALIGANYEHIDSSSVYKTVRDYIENSEFSTWTDRVVLLKGSRGMKMEQLMTYL